MKTLAKIIIALTFLTTQVVAAPNNHSVAGNVYRSTSTSAQYLLKFNQNQLIIQNVKTTNKKTYIYQQRGQVVRVFMVERTGKIKPAFQMKIQNGGKNLVMGSQRFVLRSMVQLRHRGDKRDCWHSGKDQCFDNDACYWDYFLWKCFPK